MRLNEANSVASTPAVPKDPLVAGPHRRGRRLWLGLVVLVGGLGWGAWWLWSSDPLEAAKEALDRRDFHTADERLAKRLADHPRDRAARLLAARSARRAGDFARAYDHLEEYSRQHGTDEAHDLELAMLRAQGGNIAEAERLFTAYSGRPESPDTPFVMEAYLEGVLKVFVPGHAVRSHLEVDDSDRIARLERAAELWLATRRGNADQVQGLVWQGRIFQYARAPAKSVAAFRAAVARDPEHFDARYHLALALGQEAPEELVHHLEILHNRRPDDQPITFYLATAHRTLGHAVEARRLLTEMIAADPRGLSALIELGLLNLDEGKVAEAEPLLQRALAIAPDAAETNLAMSRCQALAGRPDESAKYRKRFEELEAERKKPKPAPKF